MDLHLEDFLDGYQETLALAKSGENVFDMGNHVLFPNIETQQKWRYARSKNNINLSDGSHVYSFEAPSGLHTSEESALVRHNGSNVSNFEVDAENKGLAQVHRADPGSIYFTLQEGTSNPTYTFKHTGGSNWRAVPKKRKEKKSPVIPNVDPEKIKEGMEKTAGINEFVGNAFQSTVNGAKDLYQAAGRHPFTAAGIGAGAGLAYHLGKRQLYNSEAENEEEGHRALLRRIALPALALGGLGGVVHSLTDPSERKIQDATGKGTSRIVGP